jgi:SAM-dependent methyltransferase
MQQQEQQLPLIPSQLSNDYSVINNKPLTGAAATITNVDEPEVIDDWGLSDDHNFHLFAQHEIRTVYMIMDVPKKMYDNIITPLPFGDDGVGETTTTATTTNTITTPVTTDTDSCNSSSRILKKFYISCIEALTPIDMIDLGSGIHDATCHCVWTGAFLLIAALSSNHKLLHPYIFHRSYRDDKSIKSTTIDSRVDSSPVIGLKNSYDTLNQQDRPIRVLELGCGTGIGSIGLWTAFHDHIDNCTGGNNITVSPVVHITMTDADPEALKLCRTNCELNHIPNDDYEIESLCWGEEIGTSSKVAVCSPYHVVFATAVLYDISVLSPLLQTAYQCLCHDGHFVLAHVPRACYKSTHPAVSNLNEYIIHYATTIGGFQLVHIIYPNECNYNEKNGGTTKYAPFPKDALNSMTLQEMQDIGASIFVFKKCSNSTAE